MSNAAKTMGVDNKWKNKQVNYQPGYQVNIFYAGVPEGVEAVSKWPQRITKQDDSLTNTMLMEHDKTR